MEHKREFEDLVEIVNQEGASDLHLTAGRHPTIRVAGDLIPLVKKPVLSADDTKGIIAEILNEENRQIFFEKKELDFALTARDGIRFRGNAFFQRGQIGAAFRLIPNKIRTLAELNLPAASRASSSLSVRSVRASRPPSLRLSK